VGRSRCASSAPDCGFEFFLALSATGSASLREDDGDALFGWVLSLLFQKVEILPLRLFRATFEERHGVCGAV
jgi:hypothetical protein